MIAIKSHTDLGQSKKLAEILPLESADMHYDSGDECEICFGRGMYEEIANWTCEGIPRPADIPCWSLAALLSVIPEPKLIKTSIGRWELRCWNEDRYFWTPGVHANPIDACVEMILKLHELKKL